MRIVGLLERSLPLSRFDDEDLPTGELTTSMVALVTDVVRNGQPVVGYGFGSIGRFAQSGLIRERFAPRLLAAEPGALTTVSGGNLDPFKAWDVMLASEKPGGHGERCAAVGTLDMACWDAAAKIARQPLWVFLAETLGRDVRPSDPIAVYAGGGYPYPEADGARLGDELQRIVDAGFARAKIKVGSFPLAQDLARIEIAGKALGSTASLAVDAMNRFDGAAAARAAASFGPLDLWWFEDLCDPHDFETQGAVARVYDGPIAAGEAIFSRAEARLLRLHGGLRPDRDILLFDPVHCYGLPGYLQIVAEFEDNGWRRAQFWPHGGHLFCQHIVKALGLGGAEINPFCFRPFGDLSEDQDLDGGRLLLPERPGIGFESVTELAPLFASLT